MGSVDNNGIWKYDEDDAINGWSPYMNLGMNSVSKAVTTLRQNSVPNATSLSDANTKVAALKAQGLTPSTSNPFLFMRTDTKTIWSYDNSTWKELYVSDSNWKGHGGSIASGFSIDSPIQYRIINDIVYWRGQFHAPGKVLGNSVVISNIASEARPSGGDRPLTVAVDLSTQVSVKISSDGTLMVYGPQSNAWPIIGGSYPR